MKLENIIKQARKLAAPYRIDNGKKFRLSDIDPSDTADLESDDKPKAREMLAEGVKALAELQDVLYAHDRWGVLLIFQAMDAAGKDGAIKHVMSGVNPQGCEVYAFKAPSRDELDHDYMWRCVRCVPERGRIGIFNRSYYEEVLAVKVHREILKGQRLPPSLRKKDVFDHRYEDIAAYERYLGRNGIVVRKFFLHVSRGEQKKRFLERLDTPEKNWKFSASDIKERAYWDDYMEAYEEMVARTSTKQAPWYVVPADNKWFTRLVVSAAIIETLASLDLKYPRVTDEQQAQLAAARTALEAE